MWQKFSVNGKVKQHLRIHIRDKPYHCNVCRKQISRKCSLVSRFSMHSGNKIKHDKVHVNHFSITMLTKHIRIHTGENCFGFFDGRKLQNLRRNVQGGFCWLASYKREEGRIVGCVKLLRLIVCFTDLLAARCRSVNGLSERYENGPHRRDICRGFPVHPEVMQ